MSLLSSATFAGPDEPVYLPIGPGGNVVVPGDLTVGGQVVASGFSSGSLAIPVAAELPEGFVAKGASAVGASGTLFPTDLQVFGNISVQSPGGAVPGGAITSQSLAVNTGGITTAGGVSSAGTITTSGNGNLALIVAASQGTYAAPLFFNPGSSAYGALGNKAICLFAPTADVTFTVPVTNPIVTINNNIGTIGQISVFTGELGATNQFRLQNTSALLTIPVYVCWV